jgi:sirohydrochlorin ferrochelatase
MPAFSASLLLARGVSALAIKSPTISSARRPPRLFSAQSRTRVSCATDTSKAVLPTEDTIVPAVIVVDHGSKRMAANQMLEDISLMVKSRTQGIPVYAAHMELAQPSISDAFTSAVFHGANHVIIVPFFLAPGRHVTSDIPALVAAAAKGHEGVTYDVRAPIGTHPAIADVIMERAGIVMCEEPAQLS